MLTAVNAVLGTVAANVATPRPVVFRFNAVRVVDAKVGIVNPPVEVPLFMLAVNVVAAAKVGVTVAVPVSLLESVMVKVPVVAEVAASVPVTAAGTVAEPVIFNAVNDVPPTTVVTVIDLLTVGLKSKFAVLSAVLVTPEMVKVPVLPLVSVNVAVVRPFAVKAGIVKIPAPPPVVIWLLKVRPVTDASTVPPTPADAAPRLPPSAKVSVAAAPVVW